MKAITLKQLYAEIGKAIKNGKGEKRILLSGDDEGNTYHEMFFSVSEVEGNIGYDYQLPFGVTLDDAKKNYVILG